MGSNRVSENSLGRPDEEHDQKAINAGIEFAKDLESGKYPEVKKEYDEYSDSGLFQLKENKAKKDVKNVKEMKKPDPSQKRKAPNRYSGN